MTILVFFALACHSSTDVLKKSIFTSSYPFLLVDEYIESKKKYVDRISDYYANGIKNVKRAISIRDNIINSANNMIPKDMKKRKKRNSIKKEFITLFFVCYNLLIRGDLVE